MLAESILSLCDHCVINNAAAVGGNHRQGTSIHGQALDVGNRHTLHKLDCVFAPPPKTAIMSMQVTCIYVLNAYINDLYINDMHILVWLSTWGLDKRVCIKAWTRDVRMQDIRHVCIQDICINLQDGHDSLSSDSLSSDSLSCACLSCHVDAYRMHFYHLHAFHHAYRLSLPPTLDAEREGSTREGVGKWL